MKDILKLAKDTLERNKQHFAGTEVGRKYHILENAVEYAIKVEKSRDTYREGLKALKRIMYLQEDARVLVERVMGLKGKLSEADLLEVSNRLQYINKDIELYSNIVSEAELGFTK